MRNYDFSQTEYKNLIEELGSDWRLRNELRIQLQDKTKEILSLQKRFTIGEVSRVNYKIKSFIFNQEKSLLIKLFEKEDSRVSKLKS